MREIISDSIGVSLGPKETCKLLLDTCLKVCSKGILGSNQRWDHSCKCQSCQLCWLTVFLGNFGASCREHHWLRNLRLAKRCAGERRLCGPRSHCLDCDWSHHSCGSPVLCWAWCHHPQIWRWLLLCQRHLRRTGWVRGSREGWVI